MSLAEPMGEREARANMIKKLQDDWDKLSQDAKEGGVDPTRQQAIVERMNAVSGALNRLSQGSVTRTTLSQAVRESLERILSDHRDTYFPDVPALREELAGLRESIERRLDDLAGRFESSQCLPPPGPPEGAEGHNGGGARGQILEELESLRTNFREELGHSVSRAESRIESLERRMAEEDARFADLGGRLAKMLEDSSAGGGEDRAVLFDELSIRSSQLGRKLAELEDRAGQLSAETAAAAASARQTEARVISRLEEVLREVEGRDQERSGRSEELKADLGGRLGNIAVEMEALRLRASELERLAAEAGAASIRELEARLQGTLEEVRGELRRKEEEATRRAEGYLAQVGGQVGDLAGELEALRARMGDVESQAREAGAAIARDLEARLTGRLEEALRGIGQGEAAGLVETLRSGLELRLEGLTGDLESLRTRAEEIATQSREAGTSTARELEAQLNSRLEEVHREIARRSEEHGGRAEGFRAELEGRVGGFAGELEALRSRADQIASEAREAGAGAARELEERVNGRLDEVFREVARRSEEEAGRWESFRSELGGRADGFRAEFEGRVGGFAGELEALRSRAEEIASQAREAGAAAARELEERVNGRLDEVFREIARRSEEEAGRLESFRGGLEGRLGGFAVELEAFRSAFEGRLGSLGSDLEALRSRWGEEIAGLATLGRDLAAADDNLAEGLKDLEHRLSGRLDGVETRIISGQEALETNLRQSLAASETRLRETQGQAERQLLTTLEGQLVQLSQEFSHRIESLELGLAGVGGQVERLEKEVTSLMEQIEEKVTLLVDLVGQIQSGLPPRPLFEGLDDRLVKLEGRVRTVADKIGGVEESLVELKCLGEQLAGVRGEVGSLSSDLSASSRESGELLNAFNRKIQDLQDLLRASQERWEADRSNLRQRLSDLRDSLRDQLRTAVERSEGGGQAGLLDKIFARPDGGLRLGLEEWERLRTRLTAVVDGLESALSDIR